MPVFRLPPFSVDRVLLPSDLTTVIDRSLTQYGIPAAWSQTRGEGIVAAVLDTGCDTGHPDLLPAIKASQEFTGSPFGVGDKVGHGTHCSGTIAARGRVNGVAPACELLIGKVLGDDGSGFDQAIADGIDWASKMGAHVISMSLGSPVPASVIRGAMQRFVGRGGFVVCAAGNSGYVPGRNSVDWPARYPEACPVGASDEHGRVAPFSSRGPEVVVSAPGVNILSTYPGGSYARMSGTSMATPFVTGVVVLCLAKHRAKPGKTPLVTVDDLKAHLAATATDAGQPGRDNDYGYGLIAPGKLLDRVSEGFADPLPLPTDVRVIGPLELDGRPGEIVWRAKA